MTGSFRKIDYRLRPAKHAERYMMTDVLRRMRFGPIENYRYIGFGSVAFIDYRLFHRALGISDMISIEGTEDEVIRDRFRRNAPFSHVSLEFGMSWEVLPNIDMSRPCIVWLDYDDQLSRKMAADLGTVARKVPDGSLVAITFTTSYPTDKNERAAELARLKGDFPEFLPEDTPPQSFEKDGLAKFGRQAFGGLFQQALADADAGRPENEQRKARQVCFFRYKDGAWMTTVVWVIASDAALAEYEACRFGDLPFVKTGDEPFVIKVPLVTPYETRELERRLPDPTASDEVNWIPQRDRTAFSYMYRYLPNFAPFEPI